MSTDSLFLKPSDVSWDDPSSLHLYGNSDCKHNSNCAINSQMCSREMATDIPHNLLSSRGNLCLWHRRRMATYQTIACKCNKHDACNGDSESRLFFREYHNSWDIAIIDREHLYCCSQCQIVSSSKKYTCGDMIVCSEHASQHNFKIFLNTQYDDNYY
jgi:hypothetical protein